MKNYIQPGDQITVTAPADLTSGQGLLIGALFGVVSGEALTGATVAISRCGVFELAKTSAQAWTQGQKVYWDDTNELCTSTASGNTLIGCAAAAAANPSAVGEVLLDGAVR